MNLEKLYRENFPLSPLTEEELNKEIAWLLKTLTAEQIFFSINYCSKYYYSKTEESLMETVNANKWEILKYYDIATAKRDRKDNKESEVIYDPTNTPQGKDTPKWFRKSFNKHLFK